MKRKEHTTTKSKAHRPRKSAPHALSSSSSSTTTGAASRMGGASTSNSGKRPKHQKLEIKFDPEARRQYLTGLSARKKERRAFGLAMQKVKDRRAKLEQRREEKKALMDQIQEAERMKKNANLDEELLEDDDYADDEHDDVKEKEEKNGAADAVHIETFEDDMTKEQFGGDVIVTTCYGLPSDESDDADDESGTCPSGQNKKKTKGIDVQQKLAGNVKTYMEQIKKQMPSKKVKFSRNARGGKKGQHGAEKMIGGNAKDIKLAKKTLSRIEASGSVVKKKRGRDDRQGGGGGKKGKKIKRK